jgi:hypothetical protein
MAQYGLPPVNRHFLIQTRQQAKGWLLSIMECLRVWPVEWKDWTFTA